MRLVPPVMGQIEGSYPLLPARLIPDQGNHIPLRPKQQDGLEAPVQSQRDRLGHSVPLEDSLAKHFRKSVKEVIGQVIRSTSKQTDFFQIR
jgi:hypothetical protein